MCSALGIILMCGSSIVDFVVFLSIDHHLWRCASQPTIANDSMLISFHSRLRKLCAFHEFKYNKAINLKMVLFVLCYHSSIYPFPTVCAQSTQMDILTHSPQPPPVATRSSICFFDDVVIDYNLFSQLLLYLCLSYLKTRNRRRRRREK